MNTTKKTRVKVSLSYAIFEPLTYACAGEGVAVGQRVVVPLLNRLATGWVVAHDSQYQGKVKPIVGIIDDGFIPQPTFLNFVQAVSGIYFTSAGSLLDSAVSPKRKSLSAFSFAGENGIEKYKNQSLKELSALAKNAPLRFFLKGRGLLENKEQEVAGETGGVFVESCFLLSSDRLPYYIERIQQVLAAQQSVLIVVPDAFTAAYLKEALMSFKVDVYNSETKLAEREKLWQGYVQEGRVGVVCGGFSALLLPIKNLGLVIVERAGSANYKRLAYTVYNAPLLAQWRAQYQGLAYLEGFSTYTVKTYAQRENQTPLDKREKQVPAHVFMLPGGVKGIPDTLVEQVSHYYLEKKKVLLVVNRKGSRDFLYCGKCKKIIGCPQCNGVLEVGEGLRVECGHCGFRIESFSSCRTCQGHLTVVQDISMASLARVLAGRVVEKGILTLTAEDLKDEELAGVRQQVLASPLVIATPMLLNPFFRGIFEVIMYIRPESYVNLDEYDAAERVFAMIAEMKEMVKTGGEVVIFSTFHFHYALKLANDEEAFFEREMKYRQWFALPPFGYVYRLEIKSKTLRQLGELMRTLYRVHKDTLGIKKIYLKSRKPVHGTVKGVLEAHTLPHCIRESGLLDNRDITIELELI